MKRCLLETAARWAKHWQSGGSLKALCRTQEQQSALRREIRLREKARLKNLLDNGFKL
jgi:hypothetical protein